jgi:membrane fusion protein (multidrug efflux system)
MRAFNTPLKWFMLASMMVTPLINSCHKSEAVQHEEEEHEESKLIVTRPLKRDTTVTREYVCQIHSRSNIEVCALERGYLEATHVKEGQRVKQGDPMFQIMPRIYQAELKRAEAEAKAAKVEYDNTKHLTDAQGSFPTQNSRSPKPSSRRRKAEVNLAQTHLGFTEIKAPFTSPRLTACTCGTAASWDEGDLLTTLSDNSEVWVYFNVPETDYLEYASQEQPEQRHSVKPHHGQRRGLRAEGPHQRHRGRVQQRDRHDRLSGPTSRTQRASCSHGGNRKHPAWRRS